jgi:histidinol phosphatase-like enzyme (inositol monophosphatase family)
MMTVQQTRELSRFAHTLADASGAAILPHFRTPLAVDDKAAGSRFDPVTVADRAGEAAIRKLINARFPDHGIIGEEYGTEPADAEFVWILDPVDGTKAFISGQPTWGTLIALLHRGRAVLGLLDQPFLKERYWGDGSSASASGFGMERPLATRRPVALSDAIVWASSSITQDAAMFARTQALAPEVRMLHYGGDCYSVAMLAEGHVDMVIGWGGFEIYDIAAHIPIVTGAGGVLTALDGGDALRADDMIAAGDATCHAAALAILNGTSGA